MRYQSGNLGEQHLQREFDFNYWSDLWQKNPGEFERQRKDMVTQLIASAPERLQARLRGLEFEMDVIRRKASSPMESCMKISNRMWHHFLLLKKGLEFDVDVSCRVENKTKAKVLNITGTKSS